MVDTLAAGFAHRLRIAILGPDDLVERMMLAGHQVPQAVDWQLVAAGYREEQETLKLLHRLEGRIDACLFTGPLPYDIAREADALSVPSTFVPLNDAALYSTLLRGVADEVCELSRVSIDTLSREEVEEAYAEIGAPIRQVSVHPYHRGESTSSIVTFHEDRWRSGAASAAVTCIRSVWQHLHASGVPTLRVLPTQASARAALRTVALMGVGSHLADSQIAVAFVELPAAPDGHGDQPYWREELLLSLHQLLLREARQMGATVQAAGDRGFLVVTTVGALAQSTDGFRSAPFLDGAREGLGIGIHVGVGVGGTAQEATAHARSSLAVARESGGEGFALEHAGRLVVLPARGAAASRPSDRQKTSAGIAALARLVAALDQTRGRSEDPHVVGAEEVAVLLSMTSRSARRLLASLTADGLAWPLPATHPAGRGRPRRRYRLVVERVTDESRVVS
jgi:hypothetical protein